MSSQLQRVNSGDMSLLTKDGGIQYLSPDNLITQQTAPPRESERRFESLRSAQNPRHTALLKLSLIPASAKIQNQKQYLNDYTENESHWKNHGSKLSELWTAPEICREDTMLTAGDATKLSGALPNKARTQYSKIPPHIHSSSLGELGALQKSVLTSRRNRWHTSDVIRLNTESSSKKRLTEDTKPVTVVNRLKVMISTLEDTLLQKNHSSKAVDGKVHHSAQKDILSNNRGAHAGNKYVACPSEVVITPQPTDFVRTPYRYDNDPTRKARKYVVYRPLRGNTHIGLASEDKKAGVPSVIKANEKTSPSIMLKEGVSDESLTHAVQTFFQLKKAQLFGDDKAEIAHNEKEADKISGNRNDSVFRQRANDSKAKSRYVAHPECKAIIEQPVFEASKEDSLHHQASGTISSAIEETGMVAAPTLTSDGDELIGREGHIVAFEDEGSSEAMPMSNVSPSSITKTPLMHSAEPIRFNSFMSSSKHGFGTRGTRPSHQLKKDEEAPSTHRLDAFRFPTTEENKDRRDNINTRNHPTLLNEWQPRNNENKNSFRDQRRNGIVGTEAMADAFRTKH